MSESNPRERPLKIKVINGSMRLSKGAVFEYAPGWVFTQDLDCRDYDWLVVFDEMHIHKEKLACHREHTILATWEPVSIKSYSNAYTRQFGHLLTNRPPEAENHPQYFLGRGYYPWFNNHGDYADTVAAIMPEKTKLISTVCSSKRMKHTAHDKRYRLVEYLNAEIEGFDWYGNGVRPISKKYEALDAYKYHVVIENHIGAHHWTEKLADAFLSECLPFYVGDPAIFEIFPKDSLIPIPINDYDEAAHIIQAAIADGVYEKRRKAVLEAKRLILTKYNFWAQVIELIKSTKDTPVGRSGGAVYDRHVLRRNPLVALEELWLKIKKGGF